MLIILHLFTYLTFLGQVLLGGGTLLIFSTFTLNLLSIFLTNGILTSLLTAGILIGLLTVVTTSLSLFLPTESAYKGILMHPLFKVLAIA